MLSYTPVTDLVRDTDDPAKAEYYQSLRERPAIRLAPARPEQLRRTRERYATL